jgi:hypothetical protein
MSYKRKKLGRIFRRYEMGQAMIEYQVLIPATILLAIAAAWLLGPQISNAFRMVLRPMMEPKACVPTYDVEDNSICSQNGECEKAEWEGMDDGSYTFDDALFVESVVIKAGLSYEISLSDPHIFETTTNDGCYRVTIRGNQVAWARIGSGPSCQAISHIDVWQAPICQ